MIKNYTFRSFEEGKRWRTDLFQYFSAQESGLTDVVLMSNIEIARNRAITNERLDIYDLAGCSAVYSHGNTGKMPKIDLVADESVIERTLKEYLPKATSIELVEVI